MYGRCKSLVFTDTPSSRNWALSRQQTRSWQSWSHNRYVKRYIISSGECTLVEQVQFLFAMHNYCGKLHLSRLGFILGLLVEAGHEFKNARTDNHDEGLFSLLLNVFTLLLALVKSPVTKLVLLAASSCYWRHLLVPAARSPVLLSL